MKLSFTRYIPACFLLFLFLFSDTNLLGATIGDWIWADANNNGLLEAGEGGIGDTDVELFDNSGNLIQTTQSNHDGYYVFQNLAAGIYTVAIVQSMLVAPLTTPGSYTVTLSENEPYLTADFGQLTTFSTSNKPPVIITKNACTAPQTPVTVCLEIFEPEGDNTTITGGSTQIGATFTILNEDCFRYTPLPGYEGIDSVFVMVCDDANPPRCVEDTIAVSVPCAGGSLAVDDEVTTTQSTPVIIEVLGNDNGQAPLEVTNVEGSPNGTTLLVNNVVVYTPDSGFIGIDSFTYSITDISNQTSSATVYITVEELPIVCELEMMQCVEADATIVLCPEYCTVEGSSLNVIEITSQIGGELIESLTEAGCYKYIPPTGFLGDDVVTVLSCNEEGNCAQTIITIEVKTSCDTGENNIIAEDDFGVAIENTFVLLGILGNDSDPQGDDFSLQSFNQPPNGLVTETEEGLLKYEPNPNFVGVDVFTYTICDVNGNCDEATVTIEVIPNEIQDCTEVAEICDNASTPTEICIEFCNVNDAVITGLSSVFDATLNINSATCFNYTASEGFAGLDEVDVIGCNLDGECDTILVTVLVACPIPTANDDTGAINIDETLNLNVLENDAQKCDYTLSASLIGDAQMGEATLDSNGDLSYTPNQGTMGQEILTYVVCNDCSESLCDTATVTITVGDSANQAPIAANDNALTLPNTATEIFILANDSDPDGDNLTATIATPPANGTVAINPDTQIATYTPNEGFTGTDTFIYQVCDDGDPVLCTTATVTITVGDVAVNNPPVAVDDGIVTQLNQLIGIGVLGNDSDPDGDALTITSISSEPLNGTVEIVGFNNSSVNYTPNFNFIGVDSFEYVICDPLGACDTAVVTVTVINPGGNLPPTAIDDDATTGVNTPISIEVLANDSDPEGGELTISTINSNPSNGTATINGGVVDYVPNTDFAGEDSFEYVVCDPQGLCDTALVVVRVVDDGGNQAPIAVNDEALTLPNTTTEIFILANDSDPDGDNLTATIATSPANGIVAINPDTQIATYTPNEGFTGTDTFTYEVCDDGEPVLCSTATVTITVGDVAVNNPPIAVDDGIVTQLNQLIGIGVLGNDSDPDGDALTITAISSEPLNGTVEIVGFNNSSVNYTPNFNFIGVDSFEYVICDPLGACDTAVVTVTVINSGGNLPPTAIDDNATTGVNAPISIEVLANDNDPEGGELTLSTISNEPSNGTATINEGVVDYVPNTDFIGVDSFEYVVCDAQGLCDTAVVVINVEEEVENQAPTAIDDNVTTEINTPLDIPVLGNDSDPDGDDLTITAINDAPSNGTVVIDNGVVNYVPNTDFIGVDSFEYVVCDPQGLCDTALVIVTIEDEIENQAPIAIDDNVTTEVNTPISIPVLGNDSDPDGDDLTITAINDAPSNGTVVIDNGIVNYVPNTDFIGVDSFEYVVCDPQGLCDTALVIVTIEDEIENQAPIAIDDNVTTEVNTPISIPVLGNDSDPDGDDLTITAINDAPSNGTVVIDNGVVNYVPNMDFIGIDSFEYVMCDPEGLCDTALVIVTIEEEVAGNQAPIAVDDEINALINTPLDIPVLDNDNDPDGDELTLTTIITEPSNGTATIANGVVTYLPDTDFIGVDSFEYVVCDPDGLCDTALVVVNVGETLPNQAPIAVDDAETIDINTGLAVDVLDNDSDPDGDEVVLTSITDLPENGTAEFNIDSSAIVYTPDTDFVGVDSFEYVICDSEGLCDTALVIITVEDNEENEPPIAVDDETATFINIPVVIPVLDNDSDPNGDEISLISITESPSNGSAEINEDGTGIVYTPGEDFEGMDTLEYVICDPEGLCDTALVFITIEESAFPIIIDTTDEDTPLTICVEEFIDINFPIDSMTVFALPENGTVLVNDTLILSDSCFVYTPAQDFNGEDGFLLGICNVAENVCDTIVVGINILPVNDPPVANDDLVNTDVNTPIEIPVLGNDSDVDGDSIVVVTIEDAPSNGEATINPDGTVTYTPDTDFVGIDTFVYVINDPDGLTDTATVFIGIGVDLGIIAVDDSDTTEMDTPIEIPVLENDLFGTLSMDSVVITILTNVANGVLEINGDGVKDTSITYSPLPEFSGTDTFEYVVCVAELCDTATVVILVEEVDTGCELFIPNAFSPNRDGINDALLIPNLTNCFPDNELVIFNRWGDEIFRMQNYDQEEAWEGTWQKNGEDVPDGTYFYILTGQDEEGVQVEPRSGFIEICR